MEKRFRTSESVTSGHPDKICDQIADAIVDALLEQDPLSRSGCEVLVNANLVVVSGEFKTRAVINVPEIVRGVLRDIGYTDPDLGFTWDGCSIITTIRSQSPEIAAVLDKPDKKKVGASDQALILGYATDETEELMPLPISLASKLVKQLDFVRQSKMVSYLQPDGKAQVTVEYSREGLPLRLDAIVVAAQHRPEISIEEVRRDVLERVIQPVVPSNLLDGRTKVIINHLGRFVEGGPKIDTGVTGRKIVTDTYGGGFIGGGALSGKDPTKIDRVAAYYGRYVAKNIVASGLAKKCEVEIAYAFGVVNPVSTVIDTFGTANISEGEILERVVHVFNFQPASMIEELDLRRPIYKKTATYGAFGWPDYPWENTSKAAELAS